LAARGEIPNSKFQIPNSKQFPNTKKSNSKQGRINFLICSLIGAYDFESVWNLEFGIWNFSFISALLQYRKNLIPFIGELW
jgi:hypothetical protein